MLQLTEENIKKIINEELGIALEVNNCSKEIFLSIVDDIKSPPYTYKEIINSPAGKLYIELKDLYLELIDDKEMFSILKNEYKISLIEIEKSIKQFLKRLGKVLIKINNDKLKIWRI